MLPLSIYSGQILLQVGTLGVMFGLEGVGWGMLMWHVVMTWHLQWTDSAPGRDTWCNVWSGGGRVGDVDVACSHDLASTVDRFCSS